MICQYCGAEMNEGLAYCPRCGAPVQKAQPQPQQGYYQQPQQEYYQQQGYYQQPENAFAEKGISTAHTLGIISIVAGVLFALAGLICGIIGYSKVNGLNAPAELQARCKSARTLCIVGICISAANMLFGIIIGVVTGCESTYYY